MTMDRLEQIRQLAKTQHPASTATWGDVQFLLRLIDEAPERCEHDVYPNEWEGSNACCESCGGEVCFDCREVHRCKGKVTR